MWVACARWHAGVLALLCAGAPASAFAYSNFQAFVQEIEAGGGGGRLFTGTPADAFSCGTCHRGAEGVPLVVEGLPDGQFEPGASYDLVLRWPELADKVSVMAEFTDADGQPAGTLALRPFPQWERDETCLGDLPPEAQADPSVIGPPAADICKAAPPGLTCCQPDPADPTQCCQPDPANTDNPYACCVPDPNDSSRCRTPDAERVVCACCRVLDPSGASCVLGTERAVLHVPECGSRFSRVTWTAPATSVEVWFSAGLVLSDDELDDLGDGVSVVKHRLRPSGSATTVTLADGGCSIGRRTASGDGMGHVSGSGASGSGVPWMAGLVCLGVGWRRGRRKRVIRR